MLNKYLKSLPYRVHTNRELGMMLKGEKPLAMFSDFPDVIVRYLRIFDLHVDIGTFVKREYGVTESRTLRVLYALPDQEWRIDAMIALMLETRPWNIEFERQQGILLGYDDWQNDFWIEQVSRRWNDDV